MGRNVTHQAASASEEELDRGQSSASIDGRLTSMSDELVETARGLRIESLDGQSSALALLMLVERARRDR